MARLEAGVDPSPRPHPLAPTGPGTSLSGARAAPAGDDPPRATIGLCAAALLVEARFRDITLASRLLRADRPGKFTIGPGRGADAPVNPAWLTAADALPARPRALVEGSAAGFLVTLAPAMRAQLWTAGQRLTLTPDLGTPEAPLELGPDAHLRIACGEVVFEIRAAEIPAQVPRPWLPPGRRAALRYPIGVALAIAALAGIARLIPPDPRALSLDMLGADRRLDRTVVIPLDVAAPAIDRLLHHAAPGSTGRAAAGPSGAAGSRRAPERDARAAVAGPTKAVDARQVAARIQSTGLLSLLNGQRSGPMAEVLAVGPAMGPDARDVLSHLQGNDIAEAYGPGGLGRAGTGTAAAGTGERALGTGVINTRGRYGDGPGGDYGFTAGELKRRVARAPEIIPGIGSVRGMLDKEIIRRTVRRHLNEVRFCYEQALAARPTLAGRVIVQFTIAPTGRVLVALLQSSTLGVASVESCVAGAVRRWEFPQPTGGGLVNVTYPFQLAPAGR